MKTREEVLRTLQKNFDELSGQLDGLSEEAAGQRPAEKELSTKKCWPICWCARSSPILASCG